MYYIKKFESYDDYNIFKASSEYVTPNVCGVNEDQILFGQYTQPKPRAGNIVYYDGENLKTVRLSEWHTTLGTPVGVVVIPEGFAPDGKARIISLKPIDSNGNPSQSHVSLQWSSSASDTLLTNYNRIPTTDNLGSTTSGSNGIGYLPSDSFKGTQSFIDVLSKYSTSSFLIPSPYIIDKPNNEYYKTIATYDNALSDFDGLINTQKLNTLNSGYETLKACWKYNDGVSNLQWYLPAMGELGYLIVRFKAINASISAVGGVTVPVGDAFWSSTECNSLSAYYLNTGNGNVAYGRKTDRRNYRPFAILN